MGAFSVNQVRHLYVVKNNATINTAIVDSDAVGKAAFCTTNDNDIYLAYKGVDSVLRSDLINIDNILYVKGTPAEDMRYPLKKFTVTLNSNLAEPVIGQDYILRVAFKQYIGMSDEDPYFKYGMAHATITTTASDIYKELALSLAKNFGKEQTKLVDIYLKTSGSEVAVTPLTKEATLNDTYTGVVIKEVPQPWRRGVIEQVPVYFKVYPTTITVNGDDVVWGTVTETTDGFVGNGTKIADLEYFCMGERGDMYRSIGFPHNIVTQYLVDETQEYAVMDIHYYYVGGNEGPQKSEKTVTLVGSSTVIKALLADLKTAGVPDGKINSGLGDI